MDIHKTKSVVNPHFSQVPIKPFQPVGEAAKAALKQILLTRYENGYASREETQRLMDEYQLSGA